jgi:hypothetical protein
VTKNAGPARRAADAWSRFWFTPADPLPLGVVRIVTGLTALAWLVSLGNSTDAFFGLGGWFDRQAYADAAALPQGPPRPFGWSALFLLGDRPAALRAAYGVAVGVVALFTLGVLPRLTAPLTWLAVASFGENPVAEADDLAVLGILSFYLAVGYGLTGLRGTGPLARRLLGPVTAGPLWRPPGERPSLGANLALRLLQVHIAVVVVTSGLHKLQFGDWWAGVALWYQLHPPLETTLAAARAHAGDAVGYLRTLSLAAYVALAWQIAFPAFAWRRGARWLLLGGGAAGATASVWLYGMPVFGPAFLAGCVSYVSAEEWRRAAELLKQRARSATAADEPNPT